MSITKDRIKNVLIIIVVSSFLLSLAVWSMSSTPEEIAARKEREKQAIAQAEKEQMEEQRREQESKRLEQARYLESQRQEAKWEQMQQMKATLKALEEHPEVMNEYLREQADRY